MPLKIAKHVHFFTLWRLHEHVFANFPCSLCWCVFTAQMLHLLWVFFYKTFSWYLETWKIFPKCFLLFTPLGSLIDEWARVQQKIFLESRSIQMINHMHIFGKNCLHPRDQMKFKRKLPCRLKPINDKKFCTNIFLCPWHHEHNRGWRFNVNRGYIAVMPTKISTYQSILYLSIIYTYILIT